MNDTITITKTIDELIEDSTDCPIDISMFPNKMGINLCSVESITWTKWVEDQQLVSISIKFIPYEG